MFTGVRAREHFGWREVMQMADNACAQIQISVREGERERELLAN